MAWNFFPCVCGQLASIDMFSWLSWPKVIECHCGRKLKVYSRDTAHRRWAEYMARKTPCAQNGG